MKHRLTKVLACAFFLALPYVSASAQQQASTMLATLNAGWLLDKSGFDRWRAACQAIGWNSEQLSPDQAKTLEGLPYCDIHNGLKWPPAVKCPKLTKEEVLRRPLVDDKGCRESKDLSDWSAYQEKTASLRAMVTRLASEGVTMIALQEVFSTEAVRSILPPGWEARTSADDAVAPRIPQHVGVAWKTGMHKPGGWDLERGLSSVGSRPLRPGLVFTDTIAGKPVQFMVVHLKASCSAQGTPISQPKTPTEQDACPALEQQVHVLEAWIDARVNQDFVLLGDFNRRLTFEKKTAPNMGARLAPKVDQLFPELNDNHPPGSLLWLAQPRRVKNADGQLKSETVCKNGHPSIDHIIVSNAFHKRMVMGPLRAHPITTDGVLDFKPGIPVAAAPTDHCPHFVEFKPK